jgi:thiamine pyrophosphate-dependent acetolactate synthase large subunit-like protein
VRPPTVADVVVDGLARGGVRQVFGAVPAAHAVGVRDGVEQAALGWTTTRTAHGAAAMAAAAAALTDAPSAALVTAAELASATPALAHISAAGLPVVVLALDEQPTAPLPPGVTAVTKPPVGVEAASAAHAIAHALQLAQAAPAGPVVVRVAPAALTRFAIPMATSCRPAPPPPPSPTALDAVGARVCDASRPVLVIGRQARSPALVPWVRALAEALPAPVLVTADAKGVLPDPHPLALGLLADTDRARAILDGADLVLALGLAEREAASVTWPAGLERVIVARWDAGDGSTTLVGDLALILEELAPRLRQRTRSDWDVALLDRLKRQTTASGAPLVHRLVRVVREATVAGTVAAADAELAEVAGVAWQSVAPAQLLLPSTAVPGFALLAALAACALDVAPAAVAFATADGLASAAGELDRGAAPRGLLAVLAHAGDGEAPATEIAEAARRAGLALATPGDERAFARVLDAAVATGDPTVIDTRGIIGPC